MLTGNDSSEISSHSDKMARLTVFSNAFILPHSVEAIAMTSTKYGISAKDLIGNVNSRFFQLLVSLVPILTKHIPICDSLNRGRANPVNPEETIGS